MCVLWAERLGNPVFWVSGNWEKGVVGEMWTAQGCASHVQQPFLRLGRVSGGLENLGGAEPLDPVHRARGTVEGLVI